MPKAKEAYVVAGDREIRISSPDRVIYEATDRTDPVTKLMVAEFFAAIGEPFMHANRNRPVALERWPAGWREGMRLSVGPTGQQDGDGFYSKRLPKGAPAWIQTAEVTTPNGRPIDELCLTEIGSAVWAAQMGTLTFHPWAVRASDVDHPDEIRIDLDPQPGTDFRDAVRVALLADEVLRGLGITGFVKTSGNRGVHVYVRIAPRWTFEQVRHAAIGFGQELARRDAGVTVNWWKEERGERIFVDFNQNNRDRTIASAYSLRPRPGAPVSTPVTWAELETITDPRDLNLFTVPGRPDAWAAIDDVVHDLEPLLSLWDGVEQSFPPDYPKMPGEPPRVQPSKKVAEHWDEDGNRRE